MSKSGTYVPPEVPPTYTFVDAANFYLDFKRLLARHNVEHFEEAIDLHTLLMGDSKRVYVYDAIAQGVVPNWLEELRSKPKVIARFGRVRDRNKQHNPAEVGSCERCGRANRKQEGVDVLLAVEALHSALTGKVERIRLYSGDGDFLPLIDALVREGVQVEVHGFNNPNRSEVTADLQNGADFYRRITASHIHRSLKASSRRRGKHRPRGSFNDLRDSETIQVKFSKDLEVRKGKLADMSPNVFAYETISDPEEPSFTVTGYLHYFETLEDLELHFRLISEPSGNFVTTNSS